MHETAITERPVPSSFPLFLFPPSSYTKLIFWGSPVFVNTKEQPLSFHQQQWHDIFGLHGLLHAFGSSCLYAPSCAHIHISIYTHIYTCTTQPHTTLFSGTHIQREPKQWKENTIIRKQKQKLFSQHREMGKFPRLQTKEKEKSRQFALPFVRWLVERNAWG